MARVGENDVQDAPLAQMPWLRPLFNLGAQVMTAAVHPFTELSEQLERAARNGTKAHLGPDLVRALIESDAYPIIISERTRELVAQWREDRPLKGVSNSETSGSNPEPSAGNGSLHGTMLTLVHDAEERQASATAEKLSHRSRRRKH